MEKLWAQKLPLILIIFFLTFIPILVYLISIRFQALDLLNLNKLLNQDDLSNRPNLNSLEELRKNLDQKFNQNPNPPNSNPQSGPTLRFNLNIEGRTTDQSTKLFVGISPGGITEGTTFLLSFLVDVPPSGQYSSLSVTGLDTGATFTAYFKGSTQITKAVTFTSQQMINDLGTVDLISGDLNSDNQINSFDQDIERKLLGQTPATPQWNKYADFNQDGVINNIDLTFVTKNLGKVGDSGAWLSSPLQRATTLGIATPSAHEASPSGGYWLWIPKF